MNSSKVNIISAVSSNYVGMDAMVDTQNKVYLGKEENYHFNPELHEAYYDNTDNSLCFITNNDEIYSFLYSEGWNLSQKDMLKHGMTVELYKEYDKLQNGVLKQFKRKKEILFNGKPFTMDYENIENEEFEEEEI